MPLGEGSIHSSIGSVLTLVETGGDAVLGAFKCFGLRQPAPGFSIYIGLARNVFIMVSVLLQLGLLPNIINHNRAYIVYVLITLKITKIPS